MTSDLKKPDRRLETSMMRALLVTTLLVAAALAAELCSVPSVGAGVCIETSLCSSLGGKSYSGHCPGAASIQCCTNIICGTGLCMQTSECDGTIETGLCPGPSTFACCKGQPCDSGKGKCMPRTSCGNGTVVTGMCPGPSTYICCENGSPTPSGKGAKIVAAARSMVGKYPYSWGGGDNNGATKGTKQTSSPYCDDRNIVGFDCSGLAKYSVYQGTGRSLAHHAQTQYNDCANKVAIGDRQPGDLVFFGNSATTIHHVAIFVGSGNMVEAPGHDSQCHGIPVREITLRTSGLINKACRLW